MFIKQDKFINMRIRINIEGVSVIENKKPIHYITAIKTYLFIRISLKNMYYYNIREVIKKLKLC